MGFCVEDKLIKWNQLVVGEDQVEVSEQCNVYLAFCVIVTVHCSV